MFDTLSFRRSERMPLAYDLRERGFSKPHDGSGLHWFQNKTEMFTAYAKCAETLLRLREGKATSEHLSMATGVFRIEHRYLENDAVKRFVKRSQLPDQKAATLLRPEVAEMILNRKMK